MGLLSSNVFNIKDEDIAKLFVLQRKCKDGLYKIIKDNLENEFKNSFELKKFIEIFDALKSKKSYTPLMPFLYEVITKTGILKYYSDTKENCFENIQAIQRLIDEAKSYVILHKNALLDDFARHLETYFKQDIKIELKKNEYKKEAVQLLTYHGSKGREFEHVFCPDLTSRNFEKAAKGRSELDLPFPKSVFSDDKEINKDAELLRLLYVGFTRAKYALHLSFANSSDGAAQNVTKYISNLFPEASYLVNEKIFELDENSKIKEMKTGLKVEFNDTDKFSQEIKSRISDLVISQTSLNKYLNCPLQYFYSDVLKIPVFVEDKDILSYGSSIHSAIDFMTKEAVKNGFWGKVEDMIKKFEEGMENAEFTTPDKKDELIERGRKSIGDNFDKLIEANPKNIISTEYKMELNFEGTILKGFADRITKDIEDKIHIYDFKTGSYKKVKEGENYYNQLRFYKFLFEELNKDKKVADTALIFFEEGCKLSSSGADMTANSEIKEKIKEVIKNIKSLNFEPLKSEENCKFCNYKLICRVR